MSKEVVKTVQPFMRPTLILICLLFVAHALHFNLLTDDGYITFRYARHMAEGHGLVFNVGERVEGYTSPLWTVLLGVLGRVGIDIPEAGRWLGILSGLAAVVAAERLGRVAGLRYPVAVAALLAASGPLAFWATGGLEAPLFTALIAWGAWATLARRTHLAMGLWVLVYLCRPEGVLFAGVTLLYWLIQARRGVQPWRVPLIFATLMAGVVATHVGLRFSYYGYPLPNTFYAKVGGDIAAQAERGLRYLAWFVVIYGGGLIGMLFVRRFTMPLLYLLGLMMTCVLYVLAVGGDGLVNWRFLLPCLPFAYVLAVAGYDRMFARRSVRVYAAAVAILVVLTVLPAFQTTYSLLGGSTLPDPLKLLRVTYANWRTAGEWLRDHYPPDTLIAVSGAGYIPYYSAMPTVDLLGLNDSHIAHLSRSLGTGRAGHEKWDSAYVLERQPDIYVPVFAVITDAEPDWDRLLAAISSFPNDADLDLLYTLEFHKSYRPVAVLLADGRYLNYFERR